MQSHIAFPRPARSSLTFVTVALALAVVTGAAPGCGDGGSSHDTATNPAGGDGDAPDDASTMPDWDGPLDEQPSPMDEDPVVDEEDDPRSDEDAPNDDPMQPEEEEPIDEPEEEPEPGLPDLVADGWSVTYYLPSIGDTNVTICINSLPDGSENPAGEFVDVSNVGTEAAGPYDVAMGIYSQSSGVAYYCPLLLSLAEAHPASATATWAGPVCCQVSTLAVPDGTYRLFVMPDVNDTVTELDEDNLSLSDGELSVVTVLGSCKGTPSSCSSRSSYECDNGCYQDAECNGSAYSCYSYYGSASCGQQDGCWWDGLYPYGYCSGSADPCSWMYSEYSCESQDGCHWDDICGGSPTACSDFATPSECSTQPGCGWY